MATELAKQYDPKDAQERFLQFWDERGYFHSKPDPNRTPFTIVIPPPNVTGALHMGHALNNTLQDVLIPSTRSASSGSFASWDAAAIGRGRALRLTRSAPVRYGRRSSICSATATSSAASDS